MILFLRNKDNETLVDMELFISEGNVELLSTIIIDTYSKFLLENLDRSDEIIQIFQQLSEMRQWVWEVYFMGRENNSDEYYNVLESIRNLLKDLANKYNLYYTED